MKKSTTIIIAAAVAAATFFAGRGCGGMAGGRNTDGRNADGGFGYAEVRIDTIVVRDTLRDTVFVPREVYIVRVDTVFVGTPGDTVLFEAIVPIERKVYAAGDYRAVVEGFRPELVEMELYRQTTFVARETTRTRAPEKWGVGLQAGYGISQKGAAAYIGVGIQYRILAW
jgi:hypothetical protein